MPLFSSRAFIIKSSELNEQDKLVYLYTNDRGLIKGIAPGALKFKNRFGSKLELFTLNNVFYYYKETKELITLSKIDLIKSFYNKLSEESNMFYFYLIAEIILKYIPRNHKDPRLFRLLESIVESLENNVSVKLLTLYFILWIQRIEGKMFNTKICYSCKSKISDTGWLSSNFEGTLCNKCKTNEEHKLTKEEIYFINWTKNNSPNNLKEFELKFNINNLISSMLKKIEFDAEINLKTKYFIIN